MKILTSRWFRLLALAMAASVYVGVPLMLVGAEPWATPLLTAALVFFTFGLVVLAVTLLQSTPVPRTVVVLATAGLVGTLVGLVMFPWAEYGPLGLVIGVPLALAAAGVALIMEWVMLKVPALALLAVIVGGTLLVSSLVGLLVQGGSEG